MGLLRCARNDSLLNVYLFESFTIVRDMDIFFLHFTLLNTCFQVPMEEQKTLIQQGGLGRCFKPALSLYAPISGGDDPGSEDPRSTEPSSLPCGIPPKGVSRNIDNGFGMERKTGSPASTGILNQGGRIPQGEALASIIA